MRNIFLYLLVVQLLNSPFLKLNRVTLIHYKDSVAKIPNIIKKSLIILEQTALFACVLIAMPGGVLCVHSSTLVKEDP